MEDESKELQAVKDILNGLSQKEVVEKFGLNKGAFSGIMKGVRIAESLNLKKGLQDIDIQEVQGVEDEPQQNEELETIKAELEAFRIENQTLRQQIEGVGLPQGDDTTIPADMGVGGDIESMGYEADTMSVSWEKVQELKEWIEEMGQDKNKIFVEWVKWRAAFLDWTDELAQMRCRMEHQRERAISFKQIIIKQWPDKLELEKILKKDKENYGSLIVWNGTKYKEYCD